MSSTPRITTLFRAREGGYHSYRIPELAVTHHGVILATCEARRDSPWDDGPIDLLIRRSGDGGETWSAPAVLVAGQPRTAHNAVLIADPRSPHIHFLHCTDYNRAFYSRSRDAGLTFDTPTDITPVFDRYRPEYNLALLGTGPGHGLRLRTGRLVVPVWFSTSKSQKPTGSSVIFSDDDGATWDRGPIITQDGDGQGIDNPMEPVLVELNDGRVMFNVRNASAPHRRAVSVSPDGVRDWSPLRFDPQLPDAFCMASICRLSPDAILFSGLDNLATSDQPGTANVGGADRKRLTVRLSRDEGATWPFAKVLKPDWSAYSDLAVGPDRTIYCLYESGCIDNLMWDVKEICLARFKEDWLTA
ncbi:MAG: glycoside hydrolase [Planctomycetes bacterium]|nr:glycoside hydrolase [Planctomycetota bacterium]